MIPASCRVTPDEKLRDAVEKIQSSGLDPIPVAEDGRLVGVLREADIQALAQRDGLATGQRQVRDAMSTDLFSVRAEQEASEALHAVERDPRARELSRVPVVDGAGRLVGMVSLRDLQGHDVDVDEPTTAVSDVESIESLVDFEKDRVGYMSDASFPASDPIPPPSTMGPCPDEEGGRQ